MCTCVCVCHCKILFWGYIKYSLPLFASLSALTRGGWRYIVTIHVHLFTYLFFSLFIYIYIHIYIYDATNCCWMYVRAGRPAFARPCVGIHKSTSLMSSSLLLQQCPACLVRLTWIVFVIGGRWPYSWCLVGCCRQDIYIYGYKLGGCVIGLVVRLFAKGPGDRGSIPARVMPKNQKMVLVASLLYTQYYQVWSNGKVGQSKERSCTHP